MSDLRSSDYYRWSIVVLLLVVVCRIGAAFDSPIRTCCYSDDDDDVCVVATAGVVAVLFGFEFFVEPVYRMFVWRSFAEHCVVWRGCHLVQIVYARMAAIVAT